MKKILLSLLFFISPLAHSAITDGKFSVNQIFDVQYYWSGSTLNASNFIAPYDKNFQTVTVTSGQYFKFFESTTNPGKYGLGLYNSDGTLSKVVHDYGDVTALGDGAIFYIGSGFFGNVISTAQGYSYGASATFTNMDTDVTGTDLTGYTWASTTPLASGQTATTTTPPPTTTNTTPVSPNTNNANLGFEAGTTQNWTISNGTGTEKSATGWSSDGSGVTTTKGITNYSPGGGKTWNVTPYGQYMMAIQAGGNSPQFDAAMTSMGLTSTEIGAIRSYLTSLGGNSSPTNASWAKRTVALEAGKTYVIAWQYLSTDYVPFNDGSAMTLVHATDPSKIPVLNNEQKRYALLGFTNPGTGNYSTDSYGSTGWQLATIVVPVDGDYVLGFSSFNLGDTALSPILVVDDLQGTTQLNGQTFNPIPPNEGSLAPPAGPTTPSLCCGGSAASFTADPAKVAKVNQFLNRTTADSIVYIDQIGNSNTITVQQTGTIQNYASYQGHGSFNNISITQAGNSSTEVNYVDLVVGSTNSANSNTVSINQTSTGGGKAVFANISDSNNTVSIQQKDSGSHWIDLTLTGGNKNVSIIQQGSAGHMANINLGGTATTLDLTQSGSTQQHYSITHTCSTAGGCGTITVNQGQ